MAIIASLDVALGARTKKFETAMSKAQRVVGRFGSAIAAAGIGISITEGLRRTIQTTREFENAMANSTAIMGDLSDNMRKKMVEMANTVAFQTKFSATEAAEAFFFLASAGLNAEQSLAALPQTAKFAQAGNFDLATATDLLTDAQSALGLTVDDTAQNLTNMKRVSDVLVKMNTKANATVQQFSEALTTKAGAALRNANKDIEEGIAVLAAFADQGIKGANAGTALSIVMRDLQTKAIKNKEAFDGLVFDNGKMLTLSETIGNLEDRLAGLDDETRKETLLNLGFTDKSVSFIQSLLGMSEAIANYEKEARKAGNTTDEIANKQLSEFEKQMNKANATIGAFQQILGKEILETFVGATNQSTLLAKSLAFALDVLDFINLTAKAFKVVWLAIKEVIVFTAGTLVEGILGPLQAMTDLLLKASKFAPNIGPVKSVKKHLEGMTETMEGLRSEMRAIEDRSFEDLAEASKELREELVAESAGEKFRRQLDKMRKDQEDAAKGIADAAEPKADNDDVLGVQNAISKVPGLAQKFVNKGVAFRDQIARGLGGIVDRIQQGAVAITEAQQQAALAGLGPSAGAIDAASDPGAAFSSFNQSFKDQQAADVERNNLLARIERNTRRGGLNQAQF